MKPPVLYIVVPCYNEEEVLPTTSGMFLKKIQDWAAEGKIAPEELGDILRSGDRTAAGPTVPAGGLYMTRLWYETPEVSFHVE